MPARLALCFVHQVLLVHCVGWCQPLFAKTVDLLHVNALAGEQVACGGLPHLEGGRVRAGLQALSGVSCLALPTQDFLTG